MRENPPTLIFKQLFFTLLFSICLLSFLNAADTGKATGTLTVDGKPSKLSISYATTKENPFEEEKTDIVIYLTDVAVTPEVMDSVSQLTDMVKQGKLKMVKVIVDENKDVTGLEAYHPALDGGGVLLSGTGIADFQPVTFTNKMVEGKVTKAESKSFGHAWSVDASFKTAVADPVGAEKATMANATPLPADGGAPGKAYLEYLKAIQSGNFDTLRKFVSADRVQQMDDPEFKKMFPMIQAMQAKNIKITGGSIAGNQATLNAQGTSSLGGGTSIGTIDMVLEGNQWKVQKDSWKSGK